MADKTTQAMRLAAEAAHTPAPHTWRGRAAGVVGRYRLQPDDLPGGRWEGRIHSINTQGVEALTSLLFIEGLAKPLALHGDDVETLVRMTGSPFPGDWIGGKVEVRAVRIAGERVLRLYAPGAVAPPVDLPAPPRPKRRRRPWLVLAIVLLLVVLAAAGWLFFFAEQQALLWTFVEQTFISPVQP